MITYDLFNKFNEIAHFCTPREGGVSVGNYASFNISPFSGDEPEHQKQNLEILGRYANIASDNIILPYQTHGTEIRIIDKAFIEMTADQKTDYLNGVDALITNKHLICIGVTTADCVPLTFYDPIKRVVAVAHAGWRGTCARIATKTINVMHSAFGCHPTDLHVVVGPSISGAVYNVGQELYDNFAKEGFPCNEIFHKEHDKLYLDLWKANEWLLANEGISPTQIEVSGICTYTHHEEFFSARRLGIKSGRMLSGIYIK